MQGPMPFRPSDYHGKVFTIWVFGAGEQRGIELGMKVAPLLSLCHPNQKLENHSKDYFLHVSYNHSNILFNIVYDSIR